MKRASWEDDRAPLKSKKFVAYMTAEATWKIILVVTLILTKDFLSVRTDVNSTGVGLWWFLFTVVIVAGFVETMYIGGQAALDRYVRVAQITSRAAGGTNEEPEPVPPEAPNKDESITA